MPILLQGGVANVVQWSMDLNDFPEHHSKHRLAFPDTADVEAQGDRLIAANFPEHDIVPFVRALCKWGYYDGIAHRVERDNGLPEIAAGFREAVRQFDPLDPGAALACIYGLRSLGISFATKHLRFLTKGRAVVFDSIISERLGYPMTANGYHSFTRDCHALRDALQMQGHPSFECDCATLRWRSTPA